MTTTKQHRKQARLLLPLLFLILAATTHQTTSRILASKTPVNLKKSLRNLSTDPPANPQNCKKTKIPNYLAALPIDNKSIPIFEITWINGEKIGKWIGIVAKILQLLFILIMLADVVSRLTGSSLNSMHLMRYVTFTYCASITYILGDKREGYNGFHRGTNMEILKEFKEYIYYGYFDTAEIKFFEDPKVNGESIGFIYVNTLFLELVVYFLLSILSYATAKGLAERNKLSHFFNSLRFVFGCSFAFTFVNSGVYWWKQHNELNREKDEGKDVEIGSWAFWISWVLAAFMFIEILAEYYIIVSSSRGTPLYKLNKSNFSKIF